MADKQLIINDIRNNYGNMLNLRQLRAVLGCGDNRTALKFMNGISPVNMGKEKKFLAIDVGRRIYDKQAV